MKWNEFIAKLKALNIDPSAEVIVSYPDALHDARDSGPVDSIDIEDDGNVTIWVGV